MLPSDILPSGFRRFAINFKKSHSVWIHHKLILQGKSWRLTMVHNNIKLFIYLHKVCSSEAKYYLHLHKAAYHRNFKTRDYYREHHMHYATTRNKRHIVNCTKKKKDSDFYFK